MNGFTCNRRWIALFLLGIASGLPLALSSDLLVAWLTDAGFDPTKIGLLGLAGLPYAFKVVWSPLADRFTPPILGRRRGWMVASQLLLIGAILLLALADPRRSLAATAAPALLVAFFSATQDIVIDAWRADILTPPQRGIGAAISVCGYRLGMILSGAGGLILAGSIHIGWPAICRLAALALLCIGLTGALLAPEPATPPRPKSLKEAVLQPLGELLLRRGGWLLLLFVLIFKLPENLASAMSLRFLLDIGFQENQIGTIRQGVGVGMTIAGALLGGVIVARVGVWRSLWIFGLLHSLSNLAFLALAKTGPHYAALVVTITIENVCIGLTTAGFIAWMIGQCDARFSAFQFALLSGVMALGRVLAWPLAGSMAGALGWPAFFIASSLTGIFGLALLPWVRADGVRATQPANKQVFTATGDILPAS